MSAQEMIERQFIGNVRRLHKVVSDEDFTAQEMLAVAALIAQDISAAEFSLLAGEAHEDAGQIKQRIITYELGY